MGQAKGLYKGSDTGGETEGDMKGNEVQGLNHGASLLCVQRASVLEILLRVCLRFPLGDCQEF